MKEITLIYYLYILVFLLLKDFSFCVTIDPNVMFFYEFKNVYFDPSRDFMDHVISNSAGK